MAGNRQPGDSIYLAHRIINLFRTALRWAVMSNHTQVARVESRPSTPYPRRWDRSQRSLPIPSITITPTNRKVIRANRPIRPEPPAIAPIVGSSLTYPRRRIHKNNTTPSVAVSGWEKLVNSQAINKDTKVKKDNARKGYFLCNTCGLHTTYTSQNEHLVTSRFLGHKCGSRSKVGARRYNRNEYDTR